MAVDKARKKDKKGKNRDGERFAALPLVVLESDAYKSLPHAARSLLIEIAMQYKGDNNGRLLTSGKYLEKRGWKSSDVINRAKRYLLNAGLIYETVKGHRPNKASWYAVTWQDIDKHPAYDYGAMNGWSHARSSYKNMRPKNALLSPLYGANVLKLTPSGGTRTSITTPLHGSIKSDLIDLPTPSYGDHLEIPSAMEQLVNG